MTFFSRSILLCALAFFMCAHGIAQTAPGPAPASMVVGVIKAANVRGTVTKVNLVDKSESTLRNGEILIQDNAIVTGPGDSSVVLVFANGSTVKVGNESRLEIKEFLMDPLQADIPNVAALTAEPTVSRTHLRLEFGEMIGNVKTLNRAAGSNFSVSTPAGAAGIRGTTFRIVYRPTGDGQAFTFTLSTSEGIVLFEGTTLDGPASVNVPLGQEIVLFATINPATNLIVVSMPAALGGGRNLALVPISPAAVAVLQTTTLQIIQTHQQTSFTQVDFQTARQQHQQHQQQQQQQPQQGGQPQGQGQPPAPGQGNGQSNGQGNGQANGQASGQGNGQSNGLGQAGQTGTTNPNANPNANNSFRQSQSQGAPPPPSAVPRTTPGDGR
jgi:hypothetical protein